MTIATFFDCETTGKLHPDHRIIEASLRVCDLTAFKETENHLLRFNPGRNIDAKAQAVHGITIEELKKEPTFKDKLPLVRSILSKSDVVIAHNGISFDFPYLAQEFQNAGETIPDFRVFDTMVSGTFATDLGKSPTLSELCWALDVDYDAKLAHSGDYDTLVLREAVFRGLKLGWFKI